MPQINIGQTVDIVVTHGVIRPSSVQDILADKLVLLQITPPLSGSHVGKTILITYITEEDRSVRQCFQARIDEIREGYVTVGRGFPVIIVTAVSPSELCDLRIHKRRPPAPEMKIMLGADYLEIIDVSINGAHLVRSAGKGAIIKAGDTILLTIQSATEQYDRYARIVRHWHSRGANGPEHLAVIFTGV